MKLRHLCRIALATTLLALPALALAVPFTELTWYGHSAFKITTPTGKVLYMDPWLTNPANKSGKEQLAAITKADLILVTHGHFDHVGDSSTIAKQTGAQLVTTFDVATTAASTRPAPATLCPPGRAGSRVRSAIRSTS